MSGESDNNSRSVKLKRRVSRKVTKKNEKHVRGEKRETGYDEEKVTAKMWMRLFGKVFAVAIKALFRPKKLSEHWNHTYAFRSTLMRKSITLAPSNVWIQQHLTRSDMPKPHVGGVKFRYEVTDPLLYEWVLLGKKWDKYPDKVILFVHGGGYYLSSIKTHRYLEAMIARKVGVKLISVDYRLAPGNPYPYGVLDALRTFALLCNQKGYKPSDIILCGDSGGGGLACATTLALRDIGKGKPLAEVLSLARGAPDDNEGNEERLKLHGHFYGDEKLEAEIKEVESLLLANDGRAASLPGGAMLLSPWVDLTLQHESYQSNLGKCYLRLPEPQLRVPHAYVGGKDMDHLLKNDLCSPIFNHYDDICPLYISVGEWELFADEGRKLLERTRSFNSGHSMHGKVYDHMLHVFQSNGEKSSVYVKESYDDMKAFIESVFSQDTPFETVEKQGLKGDDRV
eukprot:CAMPEP_0113887086 /NCGR_PEP_ID=MMETSP0780_2-20120614/11974_1 /TAXON_ID=652834 /ORGANISM="Palpitomonas bilix" /LENGTH=453 /DNA_ID=CAMNT_0000875491 /DNA_START=109 /DNA_END=1470 /DNA_ORIENTATION=- /assembly_acc=CAM_ASM_000599